MLKTHPIDLNIQNPYGLATADINGNGHLDLVVGCTGEPTIAWYEAPSFKKHLVSTAHSGNITLAPFDLTRSGRPDLIVGSGFNRRDRSQVEYLHWLEAPTDDNGPWQSHLIDEIPFLHRLAVVDDPSWGQPALLVASLRGPEGGFNQWHDPGTLWLYPLPRDPFGPWQRYPIDAQLPLNHGMALCDVDRDGRPDVLIGAQNGLIWFEPPKGDLQQRWDRWVITPNESSECWAADIDGDGVNEILSIEPWHGNQLALYKCRGDLRRGPWQRTLLDDDLNNGHALEAVDLDGDGKLELVVGYNGEGTSLLVYSQAADTPTGWQRQLLDDNLGVGQMQVLDLDGDGKMEIVATGLSSGNLKLYTQ